MSIGHLKHIHHPRHSAVPANRSSTAKNRQNLDFKKRYKEVLQIVDLNCLCIWGGGGGREGGQLLIGKIVMNGFFFLKT